ncbi:hypothetical protein EDD15DRAFT_2205681 [Pisolithus albus]|nr:hypothetical protein EDD15DRAFT_2205681 [Pisolithus albus]
MQGTDLSQNLEIMIGSLHKVCKIGTWKFSTGRKWGWRFSQLEIPWGGRMGLEILQGGSWRFPREQLEIPQGGQMGLEILQGGSWRFPREQLEIPQGAVGDSLGWSNGVGDSPGGAVGDSPGWSNGVGILQDGSWRFPRMVKWGWGFSRMAVGDSPGWSNGVGDSPGGAVGDSPGWSNGVGDSPGRQLEIPQGGRWRFPREQLEISQGAVGDFPGGSWRFPMVAKWVGDSPGGPKEVGGSPLGAILVNVYP